MINELLINLEIGLIYSIIALGIYITFKVIDFPDLTCDGSFVLGCAICAIVIKNGINPFLSLFLAFIGGCLAGVTTGLLYTKLKFTDLISGILVAFMLYSVNLRIQGIPNISFLDTDTIFNNSNPLLVISIIIILLLSLIIFLMLTDFGLSLRSIGQNRIFAKNNGVNVNLMIMTGIAFSNGLIALGGAVFCQHQGFADINSGIGTVIVGLCGVIIGEKITGDRSFKIKIIGCVFGSLAYRLVITLALHNDIFGLESKDLNLITGIMLIIFMYFSNKEKIKC